MADPRTGPHPGLAAVFAESYGALVAFARRTLRDAGVPESYYSAEDAVQNAFARALRSSSHIEHPQPYIYTILKRDLWAQIKRHRLREQASAAVAGGPLLVTADCSEEVVTVLAVRDAVRALPCQQRASVWATKAMGWSQAEYGEATGKPLGTVGVHVARATAALRVALAAAAVAAAVVLCALGSIGIRRYSAAGRSGKQAPKPGDLLEWIAAGAGTIGIALGLTGAGCLACWLIAYIVRRTVGQRAEPSGIHRWCPTCDQHTEHRQLTSEEREWLATQVDPVEAVQYRRCSSRECRTVANHFNTSKRLVLPESLAAEGDEQRYAIRHITPWPAGSIHALVTESVRRRASRPLT